MFEEIKNKIGYYIYKKKIFKEFSTTSSFKDFIKNSYNYIIILPLNDQDYANSFDIAKYFKIHKKEVTLLLPEHKVNIMEITSNYNYISYSYDNISKFGLPTKEYIEKIGEQKYDVLIDLEREDNLFLTAVTSLLDAKFKVGFKKTNLESLHNFQLANTKINSEISYRNLLNSLKMF